MISEGAKRGLFLSKEKSLVYYARLEPANKDPLGRGVPRADLRGFKLLGAPLGTEEFEANILEERPLAFATFSTVSTSWTTLTWSTNCSRAASASPRWPSSCAQWTLPTTRNSGKALTGR